MNYSKRTKRRYTSIFLAGYIVLLVYSSFHFHKIDLDVPDQFCMGDTTLPVTNDVVYASEFTCQFNLVYNTVFSFNAKNFIFVSVLNTFEYIKINKAIYAPESYVLTLTQLRAPPSPLA